MKNIERTDLYCLDDMELQNYLSANLKSLYTSDLVEQTDYCLESIYALEDGINISLRVENLYNSETLFYQKFVA